jgi:hypothetical protein
MVEGGDGVGWSMGRRFCLIRKWLINTHLR